MTMNQLRYFQVLAHTEHYGRAAAELYISQPSLSRAISQLEDELHVALFAKSGRNVILTRAGHVFLQYVEQSLSELKLGVTAMQQFSDQSEILSVGYITPCIAANPFHREVTSDILPRYTFRLDTTVSQTEPLLADLKKRKYDLVLCSYSPAESEVEFIPVMEFSFVVAMRPDDPLASCDKIDPEQLKERLMVINTEPVYASLIQRIFDYYKIQPQVYGSSNEDAVLLRMVADYGVLFISTDHLKMYNTGNILKPLRQDKFHRYIYLAYLPYNIRTKIAASIIEFAARHALKEEGLQPHAADKPGRQALI